MARGRPARSPRLAPAPRVVAVARASFTTRGKVRSRLRHVADRDAAAACTTSSTSAPACRSRRARPGRPRTRSTGWPVTCSTKTSAAPGRCRTDAATSLAFVLSVVEVVAEELDAHVAADTRNHLVDPHLDGLGERRARAGQAPERGRHLPDQVLLGVGAVPLPARRQRDEDVGKLRGPSDRWPRRECRCGSRRARSRRGTSAGAAFPCGAVAHRLLQRDAREPHGVDHDRPLVQSRHEFAPSQVQAEHGRADDQAESPA